MLYRIRRWLYSLIQTIKVRGFRQFYRFSNARAWRGKTASVPWRAVSLPTGNATINARLYAGETGSTRPIIAYLHGGGWVIGDLVTHHPFCLALARATGCSVVAIDYRLAPEHPFPAGPNDCLAVISWLCGHARELAPCNGQLVLAGDSAGGNLATSACLELQPADRESIVGQALIYPATDHYSAGFSSYIEKATGQSLSKKVVCWFWDSYLGAYQPDDPAVQRAFPLRADNHATLPPTLLVTAENDPLRDEGIAYADKLRQAGVAVQYRHFANADHGFACSEGPTEDFSAFMTDMVAWLDTLNSAPNREQHT